ncbi:hypothetical protein BN1723_010755 [Verticillium longisporum]|uniref:RCC1-like domain-containing protein n=1 Tax=Verticillium longisporum TaxID=100787 RepID=A0A0G4L130_VERLO|nr:hypothetical protein BN1723_010755 [Verticillium longisporum]
MAPKGTTKAAAPKKAAIATVKPAPKATTTKKAAAAPKPAVNGTLAASKKRKADDEATDGESAEDVPKTKKAKTTKEPVKKVAAVKKTTATTTKTKAAAAAAPAKKAAAAPVAKKAAAAAPVAKKATKKAATPKSDVESASESEPEKEAPKKAEPKKAGPKKAAPKKAAVTKAAPKAASKRKATEEPTDDESDSKKTKKPVKPKKEAKPKPQPKPAAPPKHPHTVGRKINDAPTTLLDVGWGTFRSSDGILGFNQDIKIQMTPLYIPELKSIKALAAGSNHILALENKGNVLAWGCGQQNQLGRRIIERNKMSSLVPQGMGIPKKNIEKIACGQYHSFALDTKGRVYAWGLNNFAETGIREGAGEDDAVILRPTIVDSLEEHKIVDIAGGQHHSLACTEDGKLLTWGRFDGFQVGFAESAVSEDDLIRDESNNARILAVPTVVPSPEGVVRVAAGTDNNFAITKDGKAYSWGFSSNYQTGQGTIEDVEAPTLIDNTAVRGQKLVSAGAGGQFSILCGVPAESA